MAKTAIRCIPLSAAQPSIPDGVMPIAITLRKIIAHVPRKKRAGAKGRTGRKRAAIMAWIRSTWLFTGSGASSAFCSIRTRSLQVLASAHVLLGIPRQEVYRTRGYQIIYIGAGHFGAHFGPPNFELGGRRTGVRRFRQPVIPIPLLILRRGQPNCHGVSITIRRSFLPKLGE